MPPAVRIGEIPYSRFGEFVRRTYADAEIAMLKKVRRRVLEGVKEIGWAEKKLAEIHLLNQEIGNTVAGLNKLAPDIEAIIEKAYEGGAKRAADELAAADLTSDVLIPEAPKAAVKALAREAVTGISSTHTRILRTAQDIYRTVISEASAQSLTGVYTRREAAQAALDRFADKGVTGFVDAKGRNWGLSEYTEMATRTAIGNASEAGHIDKLAANDHDLLIIPAHWESCPLCAVWEGRIVSATGAIPGYPTLEAAKSEGLRHPSCSHFPQAYIEGLTRPIPKSQKARPELYKERQAQRYNERQIRRWKRRAAVAGDDREQSRCEAKVRQWQAHQREFVKRTGRARDYPRESVTRAI